MRTNMAAVENVEEADLGFLASRPGLQLQTQISLFHDVHDLPQSLVPQSLHDGGELHLAGRTTSDTPTTT